MSGEIGQVVDVDIVVSDPSVTEPGFGIPAILYSREESIGATRVYSFSKPADILEDSNFSEVTLDSVVYKMAEAMYSGIGKKLKEFKIILRDSTPATAETHTAALDAAVIADNDFWLVVTPERGLSDVAVVTEVGTWIKNKIKAYLTVSADTAIYSSAILPASADIASVFANDANGRTFVVVEGNTDDYTDCVAAGANLPYDAGSVNWKFNTKIQTSKGDNYSKTQRTNMDGDGDRTKESKHCNYVQQIAGTTIFTSATTMSNGEYIDVVRGTDWLDARISLDIYSLLLANPKIPFTNAGIGLIEATLRKSLDTAVKQGVLVIDTITVTMPDANDIPANDKSNRCLTGITFTGQLAGAINKVFINGTVYV